LPDYTVASDSAGGVGGVGGVSDGVGAGLAVSVAALL